MKVLRRQKVYSVRAPTYVREVKLLNHWLTDIIHCKTEPKFRLTHILGYKHILFSIYVHSVNVVWHHA